MDNPEVSVIMPVYNVEDYLSPCLDSILGQTLKDIEVICIDDGSTDNSLEILYEYSKKDARIKILTQQHANAGVARNLGLRSAVGKYLYFPDSDDFFDKNMLKCCVEKMEKDDSDIVIFPAQQYDTLTGETHDMPLGIPVSSLSNPFSPKDIPDKIFTAFYNCAWNKMFSSALIKENNLYFQEIARTNDMMFTCTALASASMISVIDCPFAYYRINTGNSLQSTNYITPIVCWDACKELKQQLLRIGLYTAYEQSFLNVSLGVIFYNLKKMHNEKAYAYLLNVIKYGAEIEFGFSSHPKEYYFNSENYSEYIRVISEEDLTYSETLYKELETVNKSLENKDRELECIYSSLPYRIGKIITWFPRKIRDHFL